MNTVGNFTEPRLLDAQVTEDEIIVVWFPGASAA